jgi:HTH-type transcriptional regulator, glycine betaine synthesis regulator
VSKDEEELWQSEVLVSDSIGRLIEFWGFKRNMGRLWAILYLSDRPLSAPEIQDRLQLSSGAVSMTLNELTRWGVVKKVWIQGERRDHYTAEGNFWKMISRVFKERERVEVLDAIDIMEDAIRFLQDKARAPDERARARFQEERIRELLDLARFGKQLLDALVKDAKVDGSPLMNVLLGGSDRR